jgi:pyruvate dehydrogenase E1 component
VIIAYTIKGYGLPIQGHPQNHSSLLTEKQFSELAASLGKDATRPWSRFGAESAAGRICLDARERLRRSEIPMTTAPEVPAEVGRTPLPVTTTQAALGRALLDLTREAPDVASRVVTVSPDVSSTTNLAGWLNKVGVWSPRKAPTGSTTMPRPSCTGASGHRPAHRAGHRRDQPGRLIGEFGATLEPMGSTSAADRCAL